MARVRVYRDFSEAVWEWRHLGVPEGALGRLDLVTRQFFYIDGVSREEAAPMIGSIVQKGGRGFFCKGERVLIAIAPLSLEGMMMDGPIELAEKLMLAFGRRSQDEPPRFAWSGGSLDLSKPRVMGILNVTPDSFSDGGEHLDEEAAVERAGQMKAEGADIIDIGGESTRPGSLPTSAEEEWARIAPVVRRVSQEVGLPVSVDTRRPEVAKKALTAGAVIVNDISGLEERMAEVVRDAGAGALIMHMRGEPQTMQKDTRYADVVGDTYAFLEKRVEAAVSIGISRERLAVDPGLGFGKDLNGNLQIMSRLDEYRSLGRPVLIGASRKSFLGGEANERLEGSLAAAAVACWQGVNLFRVHDVKATVRTLQAVQAMKGKR
jgi:dihydropteroate synthase